MWFHVQVSALLLWTLALHARGAQVSSISLNSSPPFSADATCSNDEGGVIDVMVVGSGLSGGTAAFYLNRKGVRVMLTDARDQAGGNLITKQGEGFVQGRCRLAHEKTKPCLTDLMHMTFFFLNQLMASSGRRDQTLSSPIHPSSVLRRTWESWTSWCLPILNFHALYTGRVNCLLCRVV